MTGPPATPSLTVSIVVFRPDLVVLGKTLTALRAALDDALEEGTLAAARVDLVDNGTPNEPALDDLTRTLLSPDDRVPLRILRGHGNVGYGRGHNLSLLGAESTYQLILNPDVIMAADAVSAAVRFLEADARVGLLTPDVYDDEGNRQFLCRRYPTIFVLFLRSFAPGFVRRLFAAQDRWYEMRDVIGREVVRGRFLSSGCFMMGRTAIMRRVGGFDPRYFMYFEDYDLSLALGRHAELAFVPSVRIVHFGGGTPRKGLRHVTMFVRSAMTFFSLHGWRVW